MGKSEEEKTDGGKERGLKRRRRTLPQGGTAGILRHGGVGHAVLMWPSSTSFLAPESNAYLICLEVRVQKQAFYCH